MSAFTSIYTCTFAHQISDLCSKHSHSWTHVVADLCLKHGPQIAKCGRGPDKHQRGGATDGNKCRKNKQQKKSLQAVNQRNPCFMYRRKHQLTLTDKGQLTLPNDWQQRNTVLSHANIEITVTKRPPSSLIKELCSRIWLSCTFSS
jgi:hypothetical protein